MAETRVTVYETCPCGAEWVGPDFAKSDRQAFRDAHLICRVLADPQAAMDALPEEDQERYRDAIQSVVDARRAAALHGDDIVLGRVEGGAG